MDSPVTVSPPPVAHDGVRILSLDGGGVRCLSQLIILEDIMTSINRESPPKPCDVFDLICGSSSGGLIAIMLGRLKMTVEESKIVLMAVQKQILKKPATIKFPFDIHGRPKSRYNSEVLENEIKKFIASRGFDKNLALQEANLRSAVTVVVATRVIDSHLEGFSSFNSRDTKFDQSIPVWAVARATSAAPSYFDPVSVGASRTKYFDDGLTNNPVNFAVEKAKKIWPEVNIACLVSIGAGFTRLQYQSTQHFGLRNYIRTVATETERTAATFASVNREMTIASRYFRFNVDHGEKNYSFDEPKAIAGIEYAAKEYSARVETLELINSCAEKLRRGSRYLSEISVNKVTTMPTTPQMSVSDQSVVAKLQERTPIIDAALVSRSESTDVLGSDIVLDVEIASSSSDPKALSQEVDNSISTVFDREGPSQVKRTESKTLEEENIVKPSLVDVEIRSEEDNLMKDTAGLILDDIEVRSLVLTAREKIGLQRLQKNMIILLEDFAQRLSSENFEYLPNFIGSRASDVIERLLKELPDNPFLISGTLPSYEEVITARDEVQDLGEVERKFETLDQPQIKVVRKCWDGSAVQKSAAFQQLSEDLRRFVFPTTKSYIKHIVGHYMEYTNLVPIYSVVLRVHWDLRDFVSQELDTTDQISDMITLTGTLSQAQALTCEAYMRQTWPQSGSQMLEAVKHVLINEKSYYQHSPTHSIQLEYFDKYLTAQISGRSPEIIETIEQFAWLSSVFRFPTEDSLGLSQTDFRVVEGPAGSKSIFAELTLRSIRKLPESDLFFGSCWTPLFACSVLAWGFPVEERGEFYGLELPFEVLLKASGAQFPVEFQNSVIIRQGPLTAFPVLSNSLGTQWHAVLGGLDEFFNQINSFPLSPAQDDITAFMNGRHFLGWLTRAQVKLGTEKPFDRSSGATEDNSRGRQLGDDLSVTLSIKPPWVGMNIGGKFVFPRAQTQRFKNNQMEYEQLLMRSARTAALYYDCSTGTGWIVPELSLLLHVAHAHLFSLHADLDALFDIGYAELLSDGGNAALTAIRSYERTVLWESQEAGKDNQEFNFKDLIRFYLDCFENRKEASRLRLEHNELRADLGLRGWDFGDLRDCTAFFRQRLISPPYLSGRPDWWSLTKNPNLMVVFGGDLGQVIVPDRTTQRPCSSWAKIPSKYNLLVCLVRCVEEICRPWEHELPRRQLSEVLTWHQPEDSRPFGDCLGLRCNPIQKTRDISGWNPFHGLRNPGETSFDGAVIFGLPNDGIKHVKSQPLPCRPLEIIAPPRSQASHLRPRPTIAFQRWIFESSRGAKKLPSFKPYLVPLVAVVVGMIAVSSWLYFFIPFLLSNTVSRVKLH